MICMDASSSNWEATAVKSVMHKIMNCLNYMPDISVLKPKRYAETLRDGGRCGGGGGGWAQREKKFRQAKMKGKKFEQLLAT